MQKYGNSGDHIKSLHDKISIDGDKSIDLIDNICYENNDLLDGGRALIITSMAEQLIKDAAFKLLKEKKINKTELKIFLHSHGIDEFWPPKTAEQIFKLIKGKVKRYEVRTIRFATAKKIRHEIVDN